jgi:hypothetical protein
MHCRVLVVGWFPADALQMVCSSCPVSAVHASAVLAGISTACTLCMCIASLAGSRRCVPVVQHSRRRLQVPLMQVPVD